MIRARFCGDASGQMAEAEVILDASASVAVSPLPSDYAVAEARRCALFSIRRATAVVVLAESADRSITLRDLERSNTVSS